jgi:signal transduction histidine kinase
MEKKVFRRKLGHMNASLNTFPDTARRMEELGRIIMAYSEVTEKLQLSHAQLTETVGRLQRELGEKNRLLERKNRLAALGEMAAGMAHEIRNPLGGIHLYASMLAEDVADRPESLALVRKISGGVKRLEAVVTQVLQFTRELRVNIAPADIAAVVEQAVELASPALGDAGVECRVDGPAALSANVDALLLGQAILNLLLNAGEAAGKGGRVWLRYGGPEEAGDIRQCRLVVHDTGPGIAPAVMDKIFNPFFTTKETGTGLGLAMVHRVVEAHDGTILVTNDGGARFELRM